MKSVLSLFFGLSFFLSLLESPLLFSMLYVQRPDQRFVPRNMSNKQKALMSCDVGLRHLKWMKAARLTRETPVYINASLQGRPERQVRTTGAECDREKSSACLQHPTLLLTLGGGLCHILWAGPRLDLSQ